MSHWNYRIGTKFIKFSKKEQDVFKRDGERIFCVFECYYKNEKPNGYAEVNALNHWEDLKDLKSTHRLISGSFKKPVIDLDNFPKEYNLKKKKNNI